MAVLVWGTSAALWGTQEGCQEKTKEFGLFVCLFIRLQQVRHSYVTRSYVTILKQYPGFCPDILCILILIRTMQSKPDCAPVQLPACCQQWHFSLLPGTHTLPGKQNEQLLTTCPPPNASHLNHTQKYTCSCKEVSTDSEDFVNNMR